MRRLSTVVLFVAALASVAVAAPAETDRWVVRVYYEDLRDTAAALQRFDLWEYNNFEERYLLVLIDPEEYPALEALGFRLKRDVERTAAINAPRVIDPLQGAGIPGYPCFRTVEETYATAQQIEAEHPTLASWVDVGDSWEKENGFGGWDMRVLRLTNSAIPGPKPPMFITGSIHAREYAPAELVTRFAEWLVDGYGTDADATWIVDYHEIHLMLMANPDARKHAETGICPGARTPTRAYCSPTSDDPRRRPQSELRVSSGAAAAELEQQPVQPQLYRGTLRQLSEPEVQPPIQDYLLCGASRTRRAELAGRRPRPTTRPGSTSTSTAPSRLVIWPWGFGGDRAELRRS